MTKLVVRRSRRGVATIVTAPTKTSYYVGDKFDPTGMVVQVTFDDSTTKTISNFEYDDDVFPALNINDTEQVIFITEDYITYTVKQAITVSQRPCVSCTTACNVSCESTCMVCTSCTDCTYCTGACISCESCQICEGCQSCTASCQAGNSCSKQGECRECEGATSCMSAYNAAQQSQVLTENFMANRSTEVDLNSRELQEYIAKAQNK